MSLQPNLRSCIRNFSAKNVRTYAAAAASKTKDAVEPFLPREELKQTNCNGVAVAAVETNRPVSRLAIFLKAGSRYERPDQAGVVHAIRIAHGSTTKLATRLGITRNVEAAGANLTCTTGREHIAYTLEATRDKIGNLSKFLKEASVHQVFKPWEVEENVQRLREDLAKRTPEIRVLEAIHKAAFRRGLGNGLYTPKYRVGNVTAEELQEYVKNNFVEASVVGVGLSLEETASFAATLNVASFEDRSCCPEIATKFNGGGEYRKNKGGNRAYVAIAIEGASLSDPKSAMASAVAQRVLGVGSRTKRGNPAGKLSPINGDNCAATAFSASYSDGGLLGVFIAGCPKGVGDATRKAAAALKEAKLTDDEVSRAKQSLESDVAAAFDNEATLTKNLGLRSLLSSRASSFADLSQLIGSVSAADVNKVLEKGGGKLALAAYGNIGNVPYLDEL